MAELKTKKNNASVSKFIQSINNEQRQKDAVVLLKIFRRATGLKPKMWGSSIVGYGSYHYKSMRSRQEGDWMLTGFSPRAQNMTVYILPGFKSFKKELKKIGKHKTSVSCLYFNKLEDIDEKILIKIIRESLKLMKKGRKICSRGHIYDKVKTFPICPTCYPGYFKKML